MFIDFKKCFTEPKHLLRLIAVVICICIACYQLSECFNKIINPPKTTHYNFVLNKTLHYPAITICRNPGYKMAIFEKYGITDLVTLTSSWNDFKFNNYTIEEFFDEVTYKFHEFFLIYGFDGFDTNVTITSSYTLSYGKCYQITSKYLSPKWSRDNGYYFYMKHTDKRKTASRSKFDRIDPNATLISHTSKGSMSGFHIFIHDRAEMFTESSDQADSFTEYVYLQPGEELEINLRAEIFTKLSTNNDQCNSEYGYSRSKCKEECLYKIITDHVGCQVPWMQNENLPYCKDYLSIFKIIQFYTYYNMNEDWVQKKCKCLKSCKIQIYSPSVRYRKDKGTYGSSVSIYFSSNLITNMDEMLGYDWNLFLADLGGSLGFLLGLSVLSAFGAVEQILEVIIKKKPTESKENDVINNCGASSSEKDAIDKYLKENQKGIDGFDLKNMLNEKNKENV